MRLQDAPTVAAISNGIILTGMAFNKSGSFADTFGNTWSGTVDYGDGSGNLPLTLNPNKTFSLTSTYSNPGIYNVIAMINSDADGVKSAAFTVNVVIPPTNQRPSGLKSQRSP
ncbi:hypothetical protein BH11PLA2_BH11PLA2_53140 [soil metagenome]